MSQFVPLRLGIVGSSGGSALAAASDCLKSAGKNVEWVVATDRPCGLEAWAASNGKAVTRLCYRDAESFSNKACDFFQKADCEDVLLFYTRRVASPLIDQIHVWNIHPALLPSFPGLHGVKDAVTAGVRVLGGTLHHVDAELDSGPIVAQVAAPLSSRMSLLEAEHLSYLQKVWLTLVWFDYLRNPEEQPGRGNAGPGVVAASPGILDEEILASYNQFWMRDQGIISSQP